MRMLYIYYGISAGAVIDSDNRLVEQTDYYPYGMPMTDVNSHSEQPYKYGGKELDRTKGLDLYDFEARQLDFSIPGFTSIDQKAQDYSFLSPYVYCAGNPLRFSDPTGMDWIAAHYGNHYFYFYDSRVSSQKDIAKVYGDGNYIMYVGKEKNITISGGDDGDTNIQLMEKGAFSVNGNRQSQEYDEELLHIGNDTYTKTDKTKNKTTNYHGSYLGDKNPVNAADESISSYAIPPTDYQDFAAFLHDKDYDKVGAAGLGGVMSEKTLEADKRLVANLKKYQHLAKSPSAKKWGPRATLFFAATSAEKQVYQQLRLTAIIFTSSLLKHL